MAARWPAFSAAIALLLLLSAPAQANPRAETLAAEIGSIGRIMDQAMVAGDIETYLSYYDEDAVLLPNFSPRLEGKTAIRAKTEADRAMGLRFLTFDGSVQDAWECHGIVYAVGTYALTFTLPGTEQAVADRGKFVSIWRRDARGELKILYDIWNTDALVGN